MACDLLMPSSQGGANNPAFSPLTLFECTITNAQMLIDSMADRDLMQALKIAGGLHTHIVGVIEPRYDRVCQRSDEHEACCQAAAAAATSATLTPSKSAGAANSASFGANGSGADLKSAVAAAAAAAGLKSESTGSVAAGGVKSELLDPDAFPEEDEEDCLILEEDCSFPAAAAAMSPSASSSASRKRHRPLSPSSSLQMPGGASAGFPGSAQQLAECKNALRMAYKNIKGNGPHLFDFALSFHDPSNQRVSEQIIATARQQLSHLRLPNDVWWSQAGNLCKRIKIELNNNKRRNRQFRCRQKVVLQLIILLAT
ncbi:hypothetical protein BOX15_Mlig028241g1 [Macrostomum lignano]|uniref:Uncharacterized protein n=1 Tax=Macrostomum lignano TaxID=282301 RepID=A0A267G2Z8_9PLAT|nr:hypothetical protein BOX15_Mlig002080g5 [Macrostomum lignano]PAA80386.1 hypothetical protein BOX15_Mlig028241g1 [Macrostomum lignano]